MERFVFEDVQCRVTFEQVCKKLLLEEAEDIALMRPLFDKAKAIARPKTLCRICSVDGIDGDQVTIDGIAFRSQVLAKNLSGIHRVFAYIGTCGREVDDWSHQEQDVFVSLWLDMIKEMILRDAQAQFHARIRETFGLEKFSTMSPGSGNADIWPIAQQRPLFQLIDRVTEDIGVELTDGFLMTPTKSVSGVLFPTEVSFVTCALCSREHCTGRRAPFDPSRLPTERA